MALTRWTQADMPALDGRVVVVTGANSGVGLATASGFARAGAHVVLAVRDVQRGRQAARLVGGSTEVRALDLASLASVREFAQEWCGALDILVNNAGVAMTPPSRTEDGFEKQFGTNHLGHFALTNLLLPHITDRVITLSSGAHRWGKIHFNDLNLTADYTARKSYGQSKLANLLFTLELQRRLGEARSPIRSLAAHPGYSATNLGTQGRSKALTSIVHFVGRWLAQPPEKGCLPVLFAATHELPGASYTGPDGRFEMHGYPTLVGRAASACDQDDARDLWTVSESLTGVRFGLV